ncbi:MAG: response regulator [Trichodesmium sp. MO_231.B1]|nr:response regulator [Trichodesmium sp. MO_231.B1]
MICTQEAQEWATNSRTFNQRTILGYEGKKRRVLVGDDCWENRSVVVILLEMLGFEMSEAENVKQALEKMKVLPPDVVITDLLNDDELLKYISNCEKANSFQLKCLEKFIKNYIG